MTADAAIRRSDTLGATRKDEDVEIERASAIVAVALLTAAYANGEPKSQGDRYEILSRRFVAPCCFSDSLQAHNSPKAEQARKELREMIAKGRTDEQIRNAFIERYGEAVLVVPDGARGAFLVVVPMLALLSVLVVAVVVLRRLHKEPSCATQLGQLADLDEAELDW
jgi:cytochrome c-type biogenesis protein CcmH